MKKLLVFIFALGLMAFSAQAETAKVTVNGLVCSFCAVGIEKTFGKLEAVEKVNVNLDAKLVTIKIKDGQTLDDESIKKTIKDAGYDTVKIERINP